jgi:hypothetical protein
MTSRRHIFGMRGLINCKPIMRYLSSFRGARRANPETRDSGSGPEPVIEARFLRGPVAHHAGMTVHAEECARHCEEQRDEAIQCFFPQKKFWIASLALAMTARFNGCRDLSCAICSTRPRAALL